MNPVACLYHSEVMHARMAAPRYRFHYKVYSLLLDIDRLGELDTQSRLLSRNRFNLFSFNDADHLPEGGNEALPDYVRRVAREHGVSKPIAKVQLLCFPRLLGYVFNPLSVWYCFDADDAVIAILCEVRNTFGERHGYLLGALEQHRSGELRARHDKEFHVSPFLSVSGEYRFGFTPPTDKVAINILEYQNDALVLVASQHGSRSALTTATLIRSFISVPFLTFKVMAAIHWQALKIWLRGGQFHKKPNPPQQEVS